jgi:hypothetical protein
VAFVGFVAAMAFWPGLLSAAIAPRWVALAVLPPLLCRVDLRALQPTFFIALAGWLGYAAISIGWAPDRLTATHELIHLALLTIIAVAAAGIDDISGVLRWVSLGVAFSGALSVAQFYGWSPVEQISVPAGTFLNRAVLGEIAAPLFVWCLLSREFTLSAFLLCPLVLCQSRVAIVAAIAGMVIARPRWAIAIALSAIGYLGLAWMIGVLPYDASKFASASLRMEIWQQATTGLSVFGNGLGSFSANFPRSEYAHSDILQALYELGIGVLAPLVCGVLAFKAPASRPERAALVAVAIEVAVAFPLHLPASGFLAFLLAGRLGGRRAELRGVCDDGGTPACAGA